MGDGKFAGKTVLVGVAGGIAAYKVAGIVSRLRQVGADVHVIMSENAARFVTPLTFAALSGHPVHTDPFAPSAELAHVRLAGRADLVLVAPATADVLGKLAAGLAGDMLSTVLLAVGTRAPVVIAPAMNAGMWENPIVQRNVHTLREMGYRFVGPERGFLAEGYEGMGRLAGEEAILAALAEAADAAEAMEAAEATDVADAADAARSGLYGGAGRGGR